MIESELWGAPKPPAPIRRVLRWSVPVDDKPHEIGGGRVIHVGMKNYLDTVEVWTVEATLDGTEYPDHLLYTAPKRQAQVFGTGHALPEVAVPIGSVITPAGLVWHLFEVAK